MEKDGMEQDVIRKENKFLNKKWIWNNKKLLFPKRQYDKIRM